MTLYVNDNPVQLQQGQTVKDLLKQYKVESENGVAVAVNEQVIPKDQWSEHQLQENDKILLITASQGG